jgi:hypothetical protein
VLPLNDRVIRDSAVPLGLTHQRGASGVELKRVVRARNSDEC